MTNHDKHFKALLNYFLPDFVEIFYPKMFKRLDFSKQEFLDKELLEALGKDDYAKQADLLVSVSLKDSDECELVAIHIEHQSSPQVDFPKRMYEYFNRIWLKLEKRIWPIAIFSCESEVNIPDFFNYGFSSKGNLRFDFDLLDLQKISYTDFSQSRNSLLPALKVRMPREEASDLELKIEIVREILKIEDKPERVWRLFNFINAYLQLSQEEEKILKMETKQKGTQKMLDLLEMMKEEEFAKGERKGKLEGKLEGEIKGSMNILKNLIKAKFGNLPKNYENLISETKDLTKLETWLNKVLFAETVEEVFEE